MKEKMQKELLSTPVSLDSVDDDRMRMRRVGT